MVHCDYSHLLENEYGYGIAKSLGKDIFHKDNYHPMVLPSEVPLHESKIVKKY